MGLSFWYYFNGVPQDNYQPTPLPLLNGTTIIQQPADLSSLVQLYIQTAKEYIEEQTALGKPWLLYFPFNHIHLPNSCSPGFCGRSPQGPVGDAVEEMDWAVGQLMKILKDTGADNDTVTFFTRCVSISFALLVLTHILQ